MNRGALPAIALLLAAGAAAARREAAKRDRPLHVWAMEWQGPGRSWAPNHLATSSSATARFS